MKNFYLDLIAVTMLSAVMSFHFIPKPLHEVLGLMMLAVVFVHIYWNRHALRSISKFCLFVDGLLLLSFLTIVASGVCISNHIFNGLIDMKLQRNIFIHQLHVSLPFAVLILVGIHLGHNWTGFRQRLVRALGINLPPIVSKLIAIGLIGAGLVGAQMNQLVDRLLMKHIFATPAAQLPFPIFLLLLIGMLASFTALGIFIRRSMKMF